MTNYQNYNLYVTLCTASMHAVSSGNESALVHLCQELMCDGSVEELSASLVREYLSRKVCALFMECKNIGMAGNSHIQGGNDL